MLEIAAGNILPFQNSDGSFPNGHNGPHHDPDTPVRNTSHLLLFYSKLYEKTKKEIYAEAAHKALDYLLSKKARPFNKSFYHRETNKKNKCNGLIGQAWTLEALIIASKSLNRPEAYELAEEVFLMHTFHKSLGLWRNLEIDGSVLEVNYTFNQQLWFATIGSMLNNTPKAIEFSQIFLNKNLVDLETYPDHVIFHNAKMGKIWQYAALGIKELIVEIKRRVYLSIHKQSKYIHSVGYHSFNLYALSILKENFPHHKLWQRDLMEKIIQICEKQCFKEALLSSKFAYNYNVTGVEIAFFYDVFLNDSKKATEWLNRQFNQSLLSLEEPFIKNSPDIHTSRARIYAAVRLNGDYIIDYA
jgi:hypothetical protein